MLKITKAIQQHVEPIGCDALIETTSPVSQCSPFSSDFLMEHRYD